MTFAHLDKKQYLCTGLMKRIEYILPIDYLRGSLSGTQLIEYNGARAYSISDNERVTADHYSPRLIAKVKGLHTHRRVKFYQVRTRTTVNMTTTARLSMALLGATGAIYAAIVSDKTAAIYDDCKRVCPKGISLRAFLFPILRAGLAAKTATIIIADGVIVTNPWINTGAQTVNIPANIITKFNILS